MIAAKSVRLVADDEHERLDAVEATRVLAAPFDHLHPPPFELLERTSIVEGVHHDNGARRTRVDCVEWRVPTTSAC